MNRAAVESQPNIKLAEYPDDVSVDTVTKILVVEDSMVEQMRLATMLRKFGYEVVTAGDGRAAIEILHHESVRLVISDWRMPNMSGLELCRELRKQAEFNQPYFILVTGFDSKNDLIAGMDAGADDFISKPYNSEELRVRVQAGARIVSLRQQAEHRNVQMANVLAREEAVTKTLQADLEAAAIMQRSILPSDESPFPSLEISGLFLPASTIAGDGYNFFPIDDHHMAFYHIDVSGHGAASAMLSFTIAHFLLPESGIIKLRSKPVPGPIDVITSPAKVVAELNQLFVEKNSCTRYFTMVYGVLNTSTGEGELCQAGHPYPLLVDATGKARRHGQGGMPVGMLDNARFENLSFRLGTGESLFLYSDGVPDATSQAGEVFGLARLKALLKNIYGHPLKQQMELVSKKLTRWHGGSPTDDISMMALRRLPENLATE